MFQTSDSGKCWRIINEQLGKQQTNPSSGPKKLYHNNTENNGDQEIAECINTYFTSIGSSLASKFKAQVDSASPNIIATNKESFSFSPVDSLTIEDLLNSVNIQKTSGFDQIPAKLIKLGASAIAPPLSLYTQCFLRSNEQS